MDIEQIIVAVLTAILGIGTVSAFLIRNIPKTVKYAVLAKDAIETLSDLLESLQDGKLTPEEIAEIKADVVKFREDLKK